MNYRLTRFGIATDNLDKELKIYSKGLGFQKTDQLFEEGKYNLAYVGNGSDGLIEIIEKPLISEEEKYLGKKGNITSVSFEVEDADIAFEEIKSKGVQIAWTPVTSLNIRVFGVLDRDDNLIKVYSYMDNNKIVEPNLSVQLSDADMILHHICVITKDIKKLEAFYKNVFGLKTVSQRTDDISKTGGFVFMVDPYYKENGHNIMFEIIGGPSPENAVEKRVIKGDPREYVFMGKYGYAYDHLCVTSNDVMNAFDNAVKKGAILYEEPETAFDVSIGWIKDSSDNDIEIMNPFSDELHQEIINDKIPIVHCPWE